MRTFRCAAALGVVTVALACSPSIPPPSSGDESTTRPAAKLTAEQAPSPGSIAGVRVLLLARHVRDLPTRATLDRHPNAEPILHALALGNERPVIRARAFQLLGLYPTAESEKLLLATIADVDQPAKLRAAALRGLGDYDLEHRADLRSVVVNQLESQEVMVGVAAVIALRDTPSAVPDLQRISAQDGVLDQVRKAARGEQ